MSSYQLLLDKISVLQKKASSLRENEKRRVVVEMRKLIELYEVQPAELFSDAKPLITSKPSAAVKLISGKRAKRVLSPKYRDPATGKTWNGHGKRPFWLVGDKEAYLIDKEAGAAGDAARSKKGAKSPKRAGKRKTAQKVDSPKVDTGSPAPSASPTA